MSARRSNMSIFFIKTPGFIVFTNQLCIQSIRLGWVRKAPLYTWYDGRDDWSSWDIQDPFIVTMPDISLCRCQLTSTPNLAFFGVHPLSFIHSSLVHYHLQVQANPKKKLHKKTDAIFSIYGKNGINPWHFFKFSLRPFEVIEAEGGQFWSWKKILL